MGRTATPPASPARRLPGSALSRQDERERKPNRLRATLALGRAAIRTMPGRLPSGPLGRARPSCE